MVRDFHVTNRSEDIATYAGILGSSFMVGRFLFSVIWGVAADRYGRKPVIIIGAISIIVLNTLFGLSVNYWMAISTRFLLGTFNGLIGTIKAYATEVSREEHHAAGLSIVTTTWGIGLIIGPAIGGFLAQPTQKYPYIFSTDSFWERFPYFLPCVVISTFAIPVLVLSFLLPETLHKHPHGQEEEKYDPNVISIDIEKEEPQNEKACMEGKKKGKMSTLKSIINNWPVMSTIIINCIYSLHDIAYSEIFSLWAVSPKRLGGLSFTTSQVGEILAISGFGLLIFQLTTFSPLAKLFGPIHVTRMSALISIPLLSAYPFIALLRDQALWIIINCASLLKNILSVMTITGTFLLLNNAAPQDQRAAANGLQMSGMSFFKAIGPAAAGVLFSWGQKRQNSDFLPGFHMVCFILNIIVIIFTIMTFDPILPRSTNKPLAKDGNDLGSEKQRQIEQEDVPAS
ncbi:protein ZINC INDUCED FACILITATOR-LIKE 1 isoform X2 [Cryptomeria japonica]|nr:protein ZINC INDUCED FACILITATOR-LIKE 1 isoform X2 [Cryptomeria japonica]